MAGDVGNDGCANAEDLLWRSDLRAGGFMGAAAAFLLGADAGLPLAIDAGPETVRDSRRTPFFGVPFVCVALVV
jgi:hypothetical protein